MKKTIWTVLLLPALFSVHAQSGRKPDADELSRFFDTAVPALMEKFHVVGAVVGVSDRSNTLFLRGYGSADLDKEISVDPEKTLFRAGSISKLFTWTAIMQLEEQGKLDLNDPVEKYLDFDIPDTFDQPIRVIDLMNHTPGFADRMIGLFVQDERQKQTLKESVIREIPKRIRPPGIEVAYSNYGTMLAGYIVERLSGMSYEQYVEANILDPLGMDRSTFEQPPPSDLAEHLATAYAYDVGKYVPQKFEIVSGVSAGALSTTAPDMMRFYRAYLNDGQLNGARILKEETVRRMRETSFRHDPRANGIAHGFFELGHGDVVVFGHGGDTIFFHSISGYLPEEDMAYFISTTSAAGIQMIQKLQDQMFDEFFPVPTGSELASEAGLNPDLQEYTGAFAMNRRSEGDPTKIFGAFSLVSPKISKDGEGLHIASMFDPEGSVYVPVARDIFQQKDGRMRFVFLRDDRGRVQSLYAHELPAFLFTRPPWIETPAVSIAVLIFGLLFFLTALIAPPTGLLTLIPRLRPRKGDTAMRAAQWSGRAYLLLFILEVILIASLGNFIFVPIGPAHVIPLYLATAALLLVLVVAVQAWRKKFFRLLGRLHYTAFALSQALLTAFLGYWGFFFV
jgi:CubicO group peptidase (beta-lactamase class C family)